MVQRRYTLKRIKFYITRIIYKTLITFFLLYPTSLCALEQYPYFDPQKGFGIENDASPWFDGKDYPYFREMYDGKSLKPQEEGSYQKFPKNSVPLKIVLGKYIQYRLQSSLLNQRYKLEYHLVLSLH